MEDLLVIENGERVAGTFSEAEMAARLKKLRAMMAENDIDAVLFTSMHNIHYFSDFLYCSFGRPYGLAVTQERATAICANIDYGQPWRRTGETLTYTDWRRDNYVRAVQKLIGGAARIGVEFDHISIENFDKLKTAMTDADFVDISKLTMAMRMLKSDEEIALIKSATQIADIGGQACADAVGVGVGEHEVALASTDAMVREIARRHPNSEIRDTWVWFQSGVNTDGAHQPGDDT